VRSCSLPPWGELPNHMILWLSYETVTWSSVSIWNTSSLSSLTLTSVIIPSCSCRQLNIVCDSHDVSYVHMCMNMSHQLLTLSHEMSIRRCSLTIWHDHRVGKSVLESCLHDAHAAQTYRVRWVAQDLPSLHINYVILQSRELFDLDVLRPQFSERP